MTPTPDPATHPRHEIAPGIWLDARLALWFERPRLLVAADLHWGFAASHRARGNLLPWWGDDDIEARLRSLAKDYEPAEMLWLGDVVHAAEGAARAERFLRESPAPVTVLAGNHDRRWRGASRDSAVRDRYFFHHGDVARPVPSGCIEVIGHHHPAFAWYDGAGGKAKYPALAARPDRLVLPAFSPWAAGSEWRAESDVTLWIVSPKRIFPVRMPASVPA